MRAFVFVSSIGLSFVLGWLSRGAVYQVEGAGQTALVSESSSTLGRSADTKAPVASGERVSGVALSQHESAPTSTAITSTAMQAETSAEPEDSLAHFLSLLNRHLYPQAMALFVRAERHGGLDTEDLKASLIQHLAELMQRQRQEAFVNLTDEYLSAYYDDIDVLLLLAEFNRRTEFYPEAISVFQRAYEYAYTISLREKVDAAFNDFFEKVDTHLESQNNAYSLGQLYLQADIAGLLKPSQRLRQAEIYMENGDVYHGRQILSQLVDDRTVGSLARELLRGSSAGEDKLAQTERTPRYASVPLLRRGNQYLIDVQVDENRQNRLLIDTGASMTTLSRAAFERLGNTSAMTELGPRMFSTANGITKGRVFRTSSLMIGDHELQNIMLAVLDFEMSRGVDGLLGMNVLDKFRFQLDQENDALLLSPR